MFVVELFSLLISRYGPSCPDVVYVIQEVLRDFPADTRKEPKKRMKRRVTTTAGYKLTVCLCISRVWINVHVISC